VTVLSNIPCHNFDNWIAIIHCYTKIPFFVSIFQNSSCLRHLRHQVGTSSPKRWSYLLIFLIWQKPITKTTATVIETVRFSDVTVMLLPCYQCRRHMLWSRGFQPVVRGPPVVRGELPRGPRATPEKLETRRILTKQNYRSYQCCRYRIQRT